jgi:Xaa-Pro aminopeptidase
MKAKKTSAELAHMIHAFERADGVVSRAQRWLCREVGRGNRITEVDFADKVYQLFKRSGASGLSFKVISAAGQNGAVIHYSIPSPDRVIQAGELMLLDTGAYYEGGYATDLTRTFLVGGRGTRASDEQRRIFTLVLKGAIAGMGARFPVGTHGVSIDALVRAPLWAAGYNYNHGTGHGVGINVHESPPNIASQGSYILEKGHVFSIEPGIYLPGFGGVRIENLCTVVDDPEREGWLAIVPLTFSPLDDRLIDRRLLTREERVWLKWFKREGRIKHSGPPAVPLLS